MWTQELQNAFKIVKKAIVQNIKDGVKTYVPELVTALISDWSKVGIGYMLTQKKCSCMGIQIDCCPKGWAVICMGSRFLTQAEKNYSAIEGELLGITWALEKTKFWTM